MKTRLYASALMLVIFLGLPFVSTGVKYLIPSLVDIHTHITDDAVDGTLLACEDGELLLEVGHGVTTVRKGLFKSKVAYQNRFARRIATGDKNLFEVGRYGKTAKYASIYSPSGSQGIASAGLLSTLMTNRTLFMLSTGREAA